MSANSNFRQVANLAGQVSEVTAGHIGASSVDSGIVSAASVALPQEVDDVVVSETLLGTLNGTTAVVLKTFDVAGSIIGLSVSSPDGSESSNTCTVKVDSSDLLTAIPLNSPVPVCAIASGPLGSAGGSPVAFSADHDLTVVSALGETSTVSVTVHYVEA